MVGCSAISCSNNSDNKDLSFHRLPSGSKNKELRKKWLYKIHRDDIANDQKVVLCSEHFTAEDFERDFKVIIFFSSLSVTFIPATFFIKISYDVKNL